MKSFLRRATAGCLALLGTLAVGAHTAAGHTAPELLWADCGDGFQCADARVPLDYDDPRGPTITIALIRKPAADAAHRIGSLFQLPGGPAQSGVRVLRDSPPQLLALLARFDVIGFDQRGTGASRPAVDCHATPPSFFARPDAVEPHAYAAAARAYGLSCLRHNRTILPHMSTANVARDVDLLRRAVGDERLTAIGISYGTDIGATYASMFPGRVRAMVLGSADDVRTGRDHPVDAGEEQSAAFEGELDRFFARCAAAGPRCGFGGTDPEDAFDTLLARLDGQPLPTGDPAHRRLSGDDVREAALAAMYTPRRWRDFATALTAATDGRPSAMLDFLAEQNDFGSYDQRFAVLAVDQRFPRGPVAGYVRDSVHAYRMFPHFWWVNGLVNLNLAQWPVEDADAFRGRIHHPGQAAPILVISNTHDPATPYAGARQLVTDLGNARLLTHQADGHASLTSGNPCLVGPALAYLTDGATLPPAGTTCRDDTDPFAS
ncbi:alpha/beta hydrolase [Paractinoplanes deccanensis]|uniref:alpha/beta hydrolase n=1 Tax=Paractinoplanes deccanensis TaxID=113561 RepID=UPI0019421C88|nr:alpha/beta hydrolase [Actinoplanes deccanensis]